MILYNGPILKYINTLTDRCTEINKFIHKEKNRNADTKKIMDNWMGRWIDRCFLPQLFLPMAETPERKAIFITPIFAQSV